MTHTDRQRPREMVARAIGLALSRIEPDALAIGLTDAEHRDLAAAAIKALRDLGYFRHDELALIKQEEGAE